MQGARVAAQQGDEHAGHDLDTTLCANQMCLLQTYSYVGLYCDESGHRRGLFYPCTVQYSSQVRLQ